MKNLNIIFNLLLLPFFYLFSLRRVWKRFILTFFLAFVFVPSSLSATCTASQKCAQIGDVTPEVEGDSGTTTLNFPVTITKNHNAGTLSFSIIHIGTDSSDVALVTSSPLIIAKGDLSPIIQVEIYGDVAVESDELFQVKLLGVTGDLTKVDEDYNTGESSILNDDFLPSASIANASITEGDSGTSTLNFPVTLDLAAPVGGVTLAYATSDGTATTADSDYASTTGTLTIAEGATTATISVTVNGDINLDNELDETFTVTLSSPTNATISTPNATGTIINDEFAPTANAGIDQTLTVGDDLTLDGSASSDDDTISTYTWTDGTTTWNGETYTIIGGMPEGTHTFTLTVEDNDGITATDTVIITVNAVGAVTVSINGASILEGTDGDTPILNFSVSLTAAAPVGGVTVDYNTTNGTATAGIDYTASNGTLTISEGNTSGTIPVTITGDTTAESDETFNVVLSNPTNATLGTATGIGVILDDDSVSSCSEFTPEFSLNIDGSEDGVVGLSDGTYGFTGSTNERYWEFNATAAPGEDINGTLRVNIYASNFNEICNIRLLNENCGTVKSWSNYKGLEFGVYVDTNTTYYIEVDDTCSNNPQIIVALLWYPDTNGTDGDYGFSYDEPAIFKGTDYIPSGGSFDDTKDYVRTKIVNKEHDITVSIVKDDNTIFTGYKGSFQFELVDATDYPTVSCKELPELKYLGVLGIKSNDNGIMTTGDDSTEHGPSLIYDEAVKNVKYRMTYLVNSGDGGGIINYNDLILYNGCVGNKQSCLWGVLTSMANNGQDPNLPEYTIADVCGLYCDPGTGQFGTGNNQISQECADCVFGPGYADCTDSFAIRPKNFDVNIIDGDIFTAGKQENFFFRTPDDNNATPLTNYTQTQDVSDADGTTFTIDLNVSNNTGCQVKGLTITPSVSFTDGEHNDNFKFDDIGDINMSIHETDGSEFAIIDAGDTPEEETTIDGEVVDGRFIKEKNVIFAVVPDHFNINATLSDHNTVNNFTYLHDIHTYENDDNYSMAAKLTVDIKAMGFDDNITRNYMETCHAKDTYLKLGLGGTNIIYPGATAAIEYFLYYNPLEDNGTADSGEGSYEFPTNTSPINITSLPIDNIESSFPADAPDGNGTSHIEYKLNFDRKIKEEVNPFQIILNDVNITDEDGVEGTQTGIADQNATMYYARSRASKYFYEDVTTANIQTPIIVDVYCDLGTTCLDYGVQIYSGAIDDKNWFISTNHTSLDGNITLMVDDPLIEFTGTPDPSVNSATNPTPTDITAWTNGIDNAVTVDSEGAAVPLTVPIKIVRESDTSTPATWSNEWLIYNPDSATDAPSPFYKVRFIGDSNWTGTGDTGDIVNLGASRKKSKKMDW